MPDVAVLVPYRPDNLDRARAWAALEPRWRALGDDYELVTAPGPEGPWCKARAVHDALQATTAPICVVADADVWCDTVRAAVEVVADGAPWAMPHTLVRRLNRPGTSAWLEGASFGSSPAGLAQHPYQGVEGGGLVVVRRSTLEEVPLDARFTGWGQEDESWALALRTLVGPLHRLTGTLWHLWHPPAPRAGRGVGTLASVELRGRYRRAYLKPGLMERVITDARAALA